MEVGTSGQGGDPFVAGNGPHFPSAVNIVIIGGPPAGLDEQIPLFAYKVEGRRGDMIQGTVVI